MDTESRLWLVVMRGPTPASATPLFSTADPAVIRAVAQALAELLGTSSTGATLLRLTRREPE